MREQKFLSEKQKIRCVVFGTLFFICMLFALPSGVLKVQADQATEQRIKEREAQVAESRKERDRIKANVSSVSSIKAGLEQQKSDLNAYVTQLDANLEVIQTNIDDIKNQIEVKTEQIAVTEVELEEAQKTQDEQYESMKQRVRFMYEHGDDMFLDIISGAAGFGERLNKARYIEELSKYDRNKLDEYIQTTELVRLTKELLEEEKETLDEAEAQLEEEESNLEELISEKEAQIMSLQDDINSKAQLLADYEAMLQQATSEISALESAIAADRARLAAENQRHFDGGLFTWPCPSCYTITSEYGWRTHPIYKDQRFHSGIDIGAQYGATIVAAYGGTVVASTYNASMGNYIMIDHGDSLYTIYMHCSKLYVSSGQDVSAGQSIAAVGSTGNSTGPHLHFTVRRNGDYQSPWNYLGSR